MSATKTARIPENHKRARAKAWWKSPPEAMYSTRQGDFVCADALDVLNSLADGTADLIFLDPPFNLGKAYGGRKGAADRLPEQQYSDYLSKIVDRSAEVLRPGGSLFVYHIPRWALRIGAMLDRRLSFNHWIAISMKNGFVRGRHLYPAHYALLHYSRDSASHLCRPKIAAATCPHCGEYTKDYGGYRGFIADGINLSDVWDDVSPVRHRKYKNRSGNELPMIIPQRATEIAGVRDGLFVDVFAGTGTTLMAARKAGMKFVANDRESTNVELMIRRLEDLRVPSKGKLHDDADKKRP